MHKDWIKYVHHVFDITNLCCAGTCTSWCIEIFCKFYCVTEELHVCEWIFLNKGRLLYEWTWAFWIFHPSDLGIKITYFYCSRFLRYDGLFLFSCSPRYSFHIKKNTLLLFTNTFKILQLYLPFTNLSAILSAQLSGAPAARGWKSALASEAPHDGKLESMGAGGKRDLADGDGHMEPGYVPGSLQRRPKTRKRKLSQLWRATQAFGRARPSLLPALVVDADLRPAAAECGSWMITFQDREACTCTASA